MAGEVEGWALRRLRLDQFRSYRQLDARFDAAVLVLVGPNGAGKTNLLEAISLIAGGRGLRNAPRESLAMRNAKARADNLTWSLFAEIETPLGARTLAMAEQSSGNRLTRLDDKPLPSARVARDGFPQVWLTPQQGNLFIGPAEERRRLMDFMAATLLPEQVSHQAAYLRAQRSRLRLLKTEPEKAEPRWLAALEDVMARHGIALAAGRRRWLQGIAAVGQLIEPPFPTIRLGLSGWCEQLLETLKPVDAEARLREALAAQRQEDRALGRTQVGPHRSDLLVQHEARGCEAALCSTGEQKALLVALTLAQARLVTQARGQAPVLLLDDVAAFLDAERREALFAALPGLSAQTWLSGSDKEFFEPLFRAGSAAGFSIESSHLNPIQSRSQRLEPA